MNTRILILTSFIFLTFTSSSQNVGIGITPHPDALLHVNTNINTKGFLITTYDNGGTVPNLGAGNRLMFYPGMAAFRAGLVDGTQWDNNNVGYGSAAFGASNIASGLFSTAMNARNSARSSNSTAAGLYTVAKGLASFVIGLYNDSLLLTDDIVITETTPLFIVGNGEQNLRTNAMVVRKNGNVEVENLIIGNGTAVSKQQSGTAAVGTNGSGYKVFTMNFPQAFAGVPKVMAIAKNEAATDFPDTFVITIRSVSTTSVTFNIQRLDLNAAWAQNLQLDWMAWE